MSTKIIFLDIDNVLNDKNSASKCEFIEKRTVITGIDNSKVKKLHKICSETGAILVLISSWRYFWERYNKDHEYSIANYLNRKLKKYGLRIYDKIPDEIPDTKRGEGIKQWLKKNFTPEEKPKWIILDDEFATEYLEQKISSHLVRINAETGLTDDRVEVAIQKLNEED